MALIDVDRHILLEIVSLNEKKKEYYKQFSDSWNHLIETSDRGDTLYWAKGINGDDKIQKLKEIRKIHFKAIRKINNVITKISIFAAKQEALLQHLVSLVEQVDTKKGKETGKIKNNL